MMNIITNYTPGWIEAEKEATEAYQNGGLTAYNSVDEMMDEFEKELDKSISAAEHLKFKVFPSLGKQEN